MDIFKKKSKQPIARVHLARLVGLCAYGAREYAYVAERHIIRECSLLSDLGVTFDWSITVAKSIALFDEPETIDDWVKLVRTSCLLALRETLQFPKQTRNQYYPLVSSIMRLFLAIDDVRDIIPQVKERNEYPF